MPTNVIINIKPVYGYYPDTPNTGDLSIDLQFVAANDVYSQAVYTPGGTIESVADHPNSIFSSIEDAIDYYKDTYMDALITHMNTNLNLGNFFTFVKGDLVLVNEQITDTIDEKVAELPEFNGDSDDVPEGSTNLYFTPERAQDALSSALAEKHPLITPETEISNASDIASTNAPTDAPENLNVVTTLLGTLTGEVNSANAKQNEIAGIVNEHGGIINDHKDKINLILAALKSLGLMED